MTVGPPIYLTGSEIWNMNQEDARLVEGRYLDPVALVLELLA